MENSERFLNAFVSIERYLRNQVNRNKYINFYELVNTVGKSNAAVRRFEEDLKEYADLRNAIVHELGGYVLAEPNERAVTDIESIVSLLLRPPVVIPLFQTQVTTLQTTDPIGDAVKLMLEKSFSQIPIFGGDNFAGLLTANTIARWLGAMVNEDVFSLKETSIARVMEYTEDNDNHAFLSRKATVYEAIELFQSYENKGKRLEAILITESGRPAEKIIGIITVADLPKALSKLGEPRVNRKGA